MKKTVSLKTYLSTTLIVATLLSLVLTGLVFSPSEIAIVEHSFIKGVSFIVENDDGTYKGFNGQTGELSYSGTIAETVVQNCLGDLTSGRTWKETVLLIGNFSLTDSIVLSSYTILNLESAELHNGGDIDTNLVQSESTYDSTSPTIQIEIVGGTFNGHETSLDYSTFNNTKNYADVGIGVLFENVENGIIRDGNFSNFGGNCVGSYNGRNNRFENNRLYYANRLGNLALNSERNVTVQGNDIGYSRNENGININGNNDVTFRYNRIHNNAEGGIYEEGLGSDNVTFTNNEVYDNLLEGVFFSGANYIIQQNVVFNNGLGGISVEVTNSTVSNNIGWNNEEGGILDAGEGYNVIMGNKMFTNTYGIVIGGDANLISSNDVRYNIDGNIDAGGSDNEYYGNKGFVTANSGKTTVANNEDVPHGLEDTPTSISLACGTALYDSVPVVCSVDWDNTDDTNFQVDVYWTNGTAISSDAIVLSWSAIYEP